MNRAGVDWYYHYDGLGSARQLTDSAGVLAASYTYDSFGNLIANAGASDNTYGFTGQQQFGEADSMVFLRARYYKPSIGRFISKDPILAPMQIEGYVGWLLPYTNLLYRPQTLNPYVYAQGNPVNFVDPSGLKTFTGCYSKCFALGGLFCFKFTGPALDKCIVGVGLTCIAICMLPEPDPCPYDPPFVPGYGYPPVLPTPDDFWISLPRE